MKFKVLFALVLLFGLTSVAFATEDDVPHMSMNELQELIKSGPVKGRFETVVAGTEISSLNLLVRDVYQTGGLTIIMFTTDEFIVAGMSGSPVYVHAKDGQEKKLGALAYSFSDFPVGEKWGGISPIEYMTNEANKLYEHLNMGPTPKEGQVYQSFSYRGMKFNPISVSANLPSDSSSFRFLSRMTRGLGGIPLDSLTIMSNDEQNASAVATEPMKLHAGMPIYVELVEWEDLTNNKKISIGATGTITDVGPKGQISAFGHPFLEGRVVRYRFKGCRIIGSVLSNNLSYKLSSEFDEPLGLIRYDGNYGIYGVIDKTHIDVPGNFLVQSDWYGNPVSALAIRVSQSPIMSTLTSYALEVAGQLAGAPMEQDASMTNFNGKAHLDDESEIEFSDITMSSRRNFGPNILYISSYQTAYERFVERVFIPLLHNSFGVEVGFYELYFDFSLGTQKVLYAAKVKFPDKVVYGTTPELEVFMVSQDNSQLFSRKIPVVIDWSKVEKPVYPASTNDKNKEPQRVVMGTVSIYDVSNIERNTRDYEKEIEFPAYFLDRKDFLKSFAEKLKLTNRKLFLKTRLRQRSGLTDEENKLDSPIVVDVGTVEDGWTIHSTKLSTRPKTVSNNGQVVFPIDLEPVPGGYMFSDVAIDLQFEVVAQ